MCLCFGVLASSVAELPQDALWGVSALASNVKSFGRFVNTAQRHSVIPTAPCVTALDGPFHLVCCGLSADYNPVVTRPGVISNDLFGRNAEFLCGPTFLLCGHVCLCLCGSWLLASSACALHTDALSGVSACQTQRPAVVNVWPRMVNAVFSSRFSGMLPSQASNRRFCSSRALS